MDYQLNFINYLKKSNRGLEKALEESYQIIYVCIPLIPKVKALRKVIATQLRLLLVDRKNSLLYKIDNNITLPPLKNNYKKSLDDLYWIDLDDMFDDKVDEIPLQQWLEQNVYYFDRDINNLPKIFDDIFFTQIIDKFENGDKEFIKNCFKEKEIDIPNQGITMHYLLKENLSDKDKKKLLELLNSKGYNNLTIGNLIKLVADKEGAHLDDKSPIGLLFSDINEDRVIHLDIIAIEVLKKIKSYMDTN